MCFTNTCFLFSDDYIDGQRMLVVLFLEIHRIHGHGNLFIYTTITHAYNYYMNRLITPKFMCMCADILCSPQKG